MYSMREFDRSFLSRNKLNSYITKNTADAVFFVSRAGVDDSLRNLC